MGVDDVGPHLREMGRQGADGDRVVRVLDDEDGALLTDEQSFVDNLVDMTVGALTAPSRVRVSAP